MNKYKPVVALSLLFSCYISVADDTKVNVNKESVNISTTSNAGADKTKIKTNNNNGSFHVGTSETGRNGKRSNASISKD